MPTDINEPVEEGVVVKLPTGVNFLVLTHGEANYLKNKIKLYQSSFRMANPSDLSDLDRVAYLELLTHRIAQWLAMRKNYYGEPISDEGVLRRQLSELSGELRQLKKALRLDKASRNADEDADVSSYLEQLRQRAKAFGLMRDEQLAKGIELCHQLIALYVGWEKCNDQERKEARVTPDDIMRFIGGKFRDDFNEIDKRFREQQRMWFMQGEGL